MKSFFPLLLYQKTNDICNPIYYIVGAIHQNSNLNRSFSKTRCK